MRATERALVGDQRGTIDQRNIDAIDRDRSERTTVVERLSSTLCSLGQG
jgi:hypothetical protein